MHTHKHLRFNLSRSFFILTQPCKGMSYAVLAELPPVYGLFCALAGPLIYTLLGTSRHLSIGYVGGEGGREGGRGGREGGHNGPIQPLSIICCSLALCSGCNSFSYPVNTSIYTYIQARRPRLPFPPSRLLPPLPHPSLPPRRGSSRPSNSSSSLHHLCLRPRPRYPRLASPWARGSFNPPCGE